MSALGGAKVLLGIPIPFSAMSKIGGSALWKLACCSYPAKVAPTHEINDFRSAGLRTRSKKPLTAGDLPLFAFAAWRAALDTPTGPAFLEILPTRRKCFRAHLRMSVE